jgi:PPE-repeat protein
MHTTVAQAEEAASGARAAAAAYEAAFAATVPPPVIALNRAELMLLVATNFFGQNTPAIAANEAEYAAMWAADAAAMYGYAGGAAAASAVTPFTTAPLTTNPAGLAAQAASVVSADGTAAGSQLLTTVPQALRSLAPPLASTASTSGLSGILGGSGITLSGPAGALLSSLSGTSTLDAGTPDTWNSLYGDVCNIISEVQAIDWGTAQMPEAEAEAAEAAEAATDGGLVPALSGLGGGGSVAAGLGNTASLGRLSVPPGWAGAAPSVTAPAATRLPAAGAAGGGPGSMLGGVPLAGAAGGRRSNAGMGAPRYGLRLSVMARPPAAG